MNTSNDVTAEGRQAFKASMREQWDRAAAGWNDHTAALHP